MVPVTISDLGKAFFFLEDHENLSEATTNPMNAPSFMGYTISVCLSVSDCRSCSKNKRYGGILCNEKAGKHTYISHYPVRFLAAEGNFNLENLLKYFILPPKRS